MTTNDSVLRCRKEQLSKAAQKNSKSVAQHPVENINSRCTKLPESPVTRDKYKLQNPYKKPLTSKLILDRKSILQAYATTAISNGSVEQMNMPPKEPDKEYVIYGTLKSCDIM